VQEIVDDRILPSIVSKTVQYTPTKAPTAMASHEKTALDGYDVDDKEAPLSTSTPGHTPAMEKRVVRKLDWHIVPLVMALCTVL